MTLHCLVRSRRCNPGIWSVLCSLSRHAVLSSVVFLVNRVRNVHPYICIRRPRRRLWHLEITARSSCSAAPEPDGAAKLRQRSRPVCHQPDSGVEVAGGFQAVDLLLGSQELGLRPPVMDRQFQGPSAAITTTSDPTSCGSLQFDSTQGAAEIQTRQVRRQDMMKECRRFASINKFSGLIHHSRRAVAEAQ